MTSNGVNRPTDVKVKEADVNRKLQVYGIIAGKLTLALTITTKCILKRFH
jgi:hypothetical protein